ncbi:TIGR02450 family Trp-rich protein [Lentisphaera profundi]|uniref:TIGR02450 family Trp-rich protein n=1 Tax=Lentisphaera profundi TaxID=1658616 RepID=A0ABY7W0I1_9BACT|nr:TIGR02450 family Trp-rich protein [Lentisphaera profundi]WDE98978.1 TIGR02450 family Trp-rich protein [Lentisphaera profundi]
MDIKHLVNSKWTHLQVEQRRRHFRVLSFSKSKKRVELISIIDNSIHFHSLDDLKNPEIWESGWSQ